MEGNDYKCFHLVFPFVEGYIDRVIGYQHDLFLANICRNFTTVILDWLYKKNSLGYSQDYMAEIGDRIFILKLQCIKRVQKHCDTEIRKLKFRLLDHLVQDQYRLGSLTIIDSSPHEHFNKFYKHHISQIPKRLQQEWMKGWKIWDQKLQIYIEVQHMQPF